MNFITLSRDQAESQILVGANPYVMISLSCVSDAARLPRDPNRHDLLRLEFSDIDVLGSKTKDLAFKPRLFTTQDANKVLDFYLKNSYYSTMMIHCDAGISRSPAVAAALTKVEGRSDTNLFRKLLPNRRVYSLILSEWFKRMDSPKVTLLCAGCTEKFSTLEEYSKHRESKKH